MCKMRENEAIVGRTDYYRIDPTKIKVQEGWNPRLSFDAQKLEELKESIKENGVLVPLRVKMNNNDEFVLIDGERRLRATLLAISEGAEIVSVPCIVERKQMNEIDMLLLALSTNQGEQLNMMEEANAIKRLMNYGLTQTQIAKKLGKSQATINNRLSLLDASPEVIKEMEQGEVTFTEVRQIVDESDGIESQKEKLEEVKAKKKARKENGTKKYGKKDFVSLTSEMLEWIIELNNQQEEPIIQIEDLINKARLMLDEEDC